jgi:Dullard-like phosphatase family protein
MTIDNSQLKKNNIYSSLFNNYKENNKNKITNEKNLILSRINKNKINKIIDTESPIKDNKIKINYPKNENDTESKISQNSQLFDNNKNALINKNLINEIIEEKVKIGNDKNKSISGFSLPAINLSKLSSSINNKSHNFSKLKSFEKDINTIIKEPININISSKHINEEKKNNSNEIDYANTDNIETTLNFLKDFTSDKNNTFFSFLILIQTHLDIELLFDSLQISSNMNTFRKKKQLNNNNIITISGNKLLKLKELLNKYFNILSIIYKNNSKNENNDSIIYPIDTFFLFPIINNILHKCLKVQICLYSIILITLNQLSEYEISILIKNHLTQLLKQISFPLLIIYENFIKDEVNLKYQELLIGHLKPEFNENFKKLFQEKKIPRKNNCNSNTQLIEQLSKDLEKCIYSIQYYSTINIKNSEIKIFGDVINQIIHSIDIKTLNQFVIIFLDSILYSELEQNHKKVESVINQNNIKNIICNDIKDSAPFLPNINPKYKYTLVLDMDETLVHFFFTKNLGMFFIRPYCFDFLNKLKEYYEIITFTAGTKEYADYILNLLDPNNEIIKYRLYRQHVTISGCSVYKDLTKIGRNLNKVIIIDNMKDNFKMQPNNGLYIKTWINDMNDYQFKDLLKILIDIVALNVMDVRLIIEKINQKINRENNLINPYYNINIEKLINEIKI